MPTRGAKAGEITGYELEMDYEHGAMVYEIEFDWNGREYEYEIDASTGEILEHKGEQEGARDGKKQENAKGDEAKGQPAGKDYIGEAKAKAAALAHAGLDGGSITEYECKLDKEDGRMVYEIDFKCGGFEYEYQIDAFSGVVVKQEKDMDGR